MENYIIKIVSGSLEELNRLYNNFVKDFPENERKSLNHLQFLMSNNRYRLILAEDQESNEVVGYAFIFETDNNMLWLDYIAIEEKYQNLGYGTLFLNEIIKNECKGIYGMFIEVEIPFKVEVPNEADEQAYDEQLKRVRFYKKLGAGQLNFDYILPTNDGGVPLGLYYKPLVPMNILKKEMIKETIKSVFDFIHSDVPNRDLIYKRFMHEIEDHYMS